MGGYTPNEIGKLIDIDPQNVREMQRAILDKLLNPNPSLYQQVLDRVESMTEIEAQVFDYNLTNFRKDIIELMKKYAEDERNAYKLIVEDLNIEPARKFTDTLRDIHYSIKSDSRLSILMQEVTTIVEGNNAGDLNRSLTLDEAMVCLLRSGLVDGKYHTVASISKLLDIREASICDLKTSALTKFKEATAERKLIEQLELTAQSLGQENFKKFTTHIFAGDVRILLYSLLTKDRPALTARSIAKINKDTPPKYVNHVRGILVEKMRHEKRLVQTRSKLGFSSLVSKR